MADGLFDKVKRVIGIDDSDYEDEFENELFDDKPQPEKQQPAAAVYPDRSGDFVQPKTDHSGKVLSMQNATAGNTAKRQQLKLLITEPRNFNDCPKLVDSLRSRKPVIINVEKLDHDVARKIFDFLSGATYAIDGKVQKVAEYIFVFAPASVDIMAEMSEPSDQSAFENLYMHDAPWRR